MDGDNVGQAYVDNAGRSDDKEGRWSSNKGFSKLKLSFANMQPILNQHSTRSPRQLTSRTIGMDSGATTNVYDRGGAKGR